MIEIIWNNSFLSTLRKWSKKHPDLVPLFKHNLNLFINDPFHPKLKTHKLRGILNKGYAFSINYEYRVLFKFKSNKTKALLTDIGTHDEVY